MTTTCMAAQSTAERSHATKVASGLEACISRVTAHTLGIRSARAVCCAQAPCCRGPVRAALFMWAQAASKNSSW